MAIYVGSSQMGYDNVNVLPAGGGQGSSTSLTARFTNIALGMAIRVCYRSESGLTATWFSNYEQVTPIRVK
jgi:hypothetical protein